MTKALFSVPKITCEAIKSYKPGSPERLEGPMAAEGDLKACAWMGQDARFATLCRDVWPTALVEDTPLPCANGCTSQGVRDEWEFNLGMPLL